MMAPRDERERDRDPDDGHGDLAVAAVRGVEERIGVPAIGRAADDGDQRPDEGVHQPQQGIASGQPPGRWVDDPIEDDHDRKQLVEDDVDPHQLELHVDVREQDDDDHEGHGQVHGGRAPQELLTAGSRTVPRGQQPAECRDADEVALDGEEPEEPGRVEPSGVGQHERLDHDRGNDEHDRCRPGDGQDRARVHGRTVPVAARPRQRTAV